jgi:hypothetical protein
MYPAPRGCGGDDRHSAEAEARCALFRRLGQSGLGLLARVESLAIGAAAAAALAGDVTIPDEGASSGTGEKSGSAHRRAAAWLGSWGQVERSYSYRALWMAAAGVARSLHDQHGVRAGDRVLLCYPFCMYARTLAHAERRERESARGRAAGSSFTHTVRGLCAAVLCAVPSPSQ